MEWTRENALRRKLGETSQHVAGPGKEFLASHQNGYPPRLADFGCWEGRNLTPLIEVAGQFGQVIGLDHPEAEPVLARARDEFPGVEFLTATLDRLPLSDSALTGALCWRVLHNLLECRAIAQALAEIWRVMVPGSPLVMAVRASPDGESKPTVLERPNGAGGTRKDMYFSRLACANVLRTAGFCPIRMLSVTEAATVDDSMVRNTYWAVHALRNPPQAEFRVAR